MPVLDVRGNLHHIARGEPARSLAALLIISFAASDDEYLPARVAVPVVAAARLECDVAYRDVELLIRDKRLTPRLAGEIFLGRSSIGPS